MTAIKAVLAHLTSNGCGCGNCTCGDACTCNAARRCNEDCRCV